MRLFNCIILMAIVLASTACTSTKRYMERGQAAFDAGKYEDASLNFRKAMQKDPKLGDGYYKLGLTDLRLNQTRDAFQVLRQAVTLMPNNHDVRVVFGEVCLQLYQADPRRPKVLYDELNKLVSWLKAEDPKGYDTLRFQGYLDFVDRKTAEGIADLESANAVKPYEPQVVHPLVRALIANQRAGEGEKLAQETIQHHKEFLPLYDELFQYYVAAKRTDQAESILKSKMANNPKQAEYVMELANFYSRLHRDAEANALVKGVLDHASDYPQANLYAGNFYAVNGDWSEAARLLEEGAKRYPQDKLAYEKDLTNVYLAQDKKEEAARVVDDILRDAPKDKAAMRLRTMLLISSGQPENIDKALAELQEAVQETPDDSISRFNLARVYVIKGDLEHARRELNDTLRARPRFLAAHALLAEVLVQMKQPQPLLAETTAVLAAQPLNRRARVLEVVALSAMGRTAEARSKLNQLLKDEPKYVDAQVESGFLDISEKKFQEAETVFRKLYDGGQAGPRATEGLVDALQARGQTEQALQVLETEVKKPGAPVSFRLILARTAAQSGKADLAADQLQQAVKQDPKSYEAHMLLGDHFRSQDDFKDAIRMYQTAADIAPKDPAPEIFLALAEDGSGNSTAAIAAYRAALARQPESPVVLNDLAFYLSEHGGSLDEALTMSQQAVQKASLPNFSDTLGWIYLKKNRPENAVSVFQNIVRKQPNNPVFQYHLGAALLAKGDKPGARAALGSALQKKPAKQDETKIKELLAQIQ